MRFAFIPISSALLLAAACGGGDEVARTTTTPRFTEVIRFTQTPLPNDETLYGRFLEIARDSVRDHSDTACDPGYWELLHRDNAKDDALLELAFADACIEADVLEFRGTPFSRYYETAPTP